MKNRMLRVALALAVQEALVLGLASLLIFLSLAMPGTVYELVMWAAVPLLGLGSAWLCVRMGAPYGMAWIAPPLCQVGAQWLLTGVLPASPGMPMVTLLASAFGAAAGHEQARRMHKGKKK